jgi:DNA glycosylase AlkZ-like
MRRISAGERGARLTRRHRLTADARASDPVGVARSLVAVHSTDPSSVYVGILARMTGGGIADVERALYEDRTLLRLLGMRRTVFVACTEIAPLIQAGCSRAVAQAERRKLLRWLAAADVAADVNGWLADAERAALNALMERGTATAADIAASDPRLAVRLTPGRGVSSEGQFNVASRVLFLLAAEGRVARGRPRGSWTSHQYRWVPMADWYPTGLDGCASQEAEVELARRWLHAYGPATTDDLRWWAGWSGSQVRRVLADLRPVDVDLDGIPGIVAADDTDPELEVVPCAALLPGLDSTPMGWQRRDWFLGGYGGRLVDRTGNIGPTVWWDGRIVGGWAQHRDGEIVWRLLEDIGSDAAAAVEAAAQRLAAMLGTTRLAPRTRGRTWLEQELR